MTKTKRERWIQHYCSSQKILLVGEGDFSFSACLANAFGYADNMVATCLHSQERLPLMHRTSGEHVENLERLGCLVLYDVDVYIMNKHPNLKDIKFDIIVFNFPHAGHYSWLCERDTTLIELHQNLIRAYFNAAKEMLQEGGEIHVTTRDDDPYNTWEVEKLGIKQGLTLKQKVEFIQGNYPGYHNKRGGNIKCNQKFPLNECYTFKFIVKESHIQEIGNGCVGEVNDSVSQYYQTWTGPTCSTGEPSDIQKIGNGCVGEVNESASQYYQTLTCPTCSTSEPSDIHKIGNGCVGEVNDSASQCYQTWTRSAGSTGELSDIQEIGNGCVGEVNDIVSQCYQTRIDPAGSTNEPVNRPLNRFESFIRLVFFFILFYFIFLSE